MPLSMNCGKTTRGSRLLPNIIPGTISKPNTAPETEEAYSKRLREIPWSAGIS